MTTLDYTGLRLTGALRIEHLGSISLHVGVNDHGWAVVEGEAGEDALEQLQGAVAGREQVIMARDESGVEQPLFAGIIRTAGLVTYGGYNRFRIELQTGTIQMDQVKRSRSFQDVGQTYSQVAQRVASGHEDGAVIPTVGLDKPLGIPVIQYRETDWAFMKRLASWCGGVVVPESHYSYPRLWFGFPERAFTCSFPEDCYTVGISRRYFELGGAAAGYRRADFLYYDVPSSQMCDLGWYTVFKGQEFLICEKWAKLERGELTFTYRLGKPGLGWGRKEYNEKISGMTILGEVLSTERETVRLKLDIDEGWAPGGPYAYTWRPETGNMMYCMPQAGTRVSLYFPNYDEQAAMAVNCVRTNGSSCARMSDPSKRSFVTEHGKEMNLYPEELSLLGGANGRVKLEDETGITISTDKKIQIVAKWPVQIKGKSVAALAPAGELTLVKGNILSGATETTVVQSYRFDLLAAKHTKAEGWRHQRFKAYDDSPKVGDFDWGGILFSVIGAVAACVVVGALSLTGIGAFVVGGLVAGVVCGALYSGRDAIEAGVSGIDFIKVVLSGAVVGGIQGLINGLVSFGVFSIGALLAGTTIVGMGIGGIMICGGVSGGFSSAVNQLLFCGTVDPNLLAEDTVRSSIFSGLFYGVSSIRTFNATGSSGGRYVGIGNQYTGNGFIFGRSNGSVGGLVVKGGQIVPSGIAYIPGKGIVFAKPIQGGGLSPVTTNQVNPYSYLPFTGPQYQLPSSTPLGVGEYNTTITWDSHVLPARQDGPGFWGPRVRQHDSRVDNYELKINPNGESYYLPLKDGSLVQFENMTSSVLQDGKLILNPSKSIYNMMKKPEFLLQKVLAEINRQLEAAELAGYKVQWLVSDPNTASQIKEYFALHNIPIEVIYFPE